MPVNEEYVLWSDDADVPPPGQPRSLLVGVALLVVALVWMVVRAGPSGLDGLFGIALFAGAGLVLLHLLKARRQEILRVWTDPSRPGGVLVRRADGAVRTLNPARVRRIRLVSTFGSYLDGRPGESVEWHSYSLVRMTLRTGLTFYTTRNQRLPDSEDSGQEQPHRSETFRRLAATFPNARISERDVQLTAQEGFPD